MEFKEYPVVIRMYFLRARASLIYIELLIADGFLIYLKQNASQLLFRFI